MNSLSINPLIFKAYDIRGIVPDELDGNLAERVGFTFAVEVKSKEVIVGRDVRLTGNEFRERVVRGITDTGVNVIDIGVVSTDEFYFACATKNLPGIMITASHNPSEYNGFKMVRKMPYFILAKEFKKQLEQNLETHKSDIKGQIKVESIRSQFIEYVLKIVPAESIRPMKVVIDTSNGSQGATWKELMKKLSIEIIPLNFEPDGNFPNHGNDIIQLENQEMLRQKVKESHADLGLIFDPDGDRCLLVDDRGVSVPGDWITALLGATEIKRNPGATILYDVRSSDAVPDIVAEHGGKPYLFKPGHAYIKKEMQDNQIVFGGEVSGHYYFKDFWYADSGILSALTLLAYVSELDGPLSEVIKNLENKYYLSGEINSKVKDREATLEKIKKYFHDAEFNYISGVAIRYPDWHCVVRPSDNEPLVRLTVEANSQVLMEEKRNLLLSLIRSI